MQMETWKHQATGAPVLRFPSDGTHPEQLQWISPQVSKLSQHLLQKQSICGICGDGQRVVLNWMSEFRGSWMLRCNLNFRFISLRTINGPPWYSAMDSAVFSLQAVFPSCKCQIFYLRAVNGIFFLITNAHSHISTSLQWTTLSSERLWLMQTEI